MQFDVEIPDWEIGEYAASHLGMVDSDDVDEATVREWMENFGLHAERLLDYRDVSDYHDGNAHKGSITFCTDPVCAAHGYLD